MRFWNFTVNPGAEGTSENVELRVEGDIVSDDDTWFYEWFDMASSSPNAFRNELNQYKNKDITVWIDSYGGDVFAAAGIYNALKEHNGKITVKIDSKAMSAASVIAMAGDEILMSPGAIMMIHNPLTGVYGYASDMRKTADILDVVKDSIMNSYVLKTQRTKEEISSLMDNETYMSADAAIKQGFADGMLYANESEPTITNFSFNKLCIQNSVNKSIKQLINFEKENVEPENNLEKEKLLVELDLI